MQASKASTEILVGGSTTVYPLSILAGDAYMKQHPGIKITVQPGGSGVGITGVGNDLLDIGASSEEALQTHRKPRTPTLFGMNLVDRLFV